MCRQSSKLYIQHIFCLSGQPLPNLLQPFYNLGASKFVHWRFRVIKFLGQRVMWLNSCVRLRQGCQNTCLVVLFNSRLWKLDLSGWTYLLPLFTPVPPPPPIIPRPTISRIELWTFWLLPWFLTELDRAIFTFLPTQWPCQFSDLPKVQRSTTKPRHSIFLHTKLVDHNCRRSIFMCVFSNQCQSSQIFANIRTHLFGYFFSFPISIQKGST